MAEPPSQASCKDFRRLCPAASFRQIARKRPPGELASLSNAQIGFPDLDPACRAKLRYGFLCQVWSADGRAQPKPASVPLVWPPQFRCWDAAFSICADSGERSPKRGLGKLPQLAPFAQDLQFLALTPTIPIRNRPAKQVGDQRWLNQHSMNRGSTRQSVLCAVSASPECLMNRGELHRLRTGSPAHHPRPSGPGSTFPFQVAPPIERLSDLRISPC